MMFKNHALRRQLLIAAQRIGKGGGVKLGQGIIPVIEQRIECALTIAGSALRRLTVGAIERDAGAAPL